MQRRRRLDSRLHGPLRGAILSVSFVGVAAAGVSDFAHPGASLSLADRSLLGEVDFDLSGGSVANAGDVDGDGLSDILIGAANNDAGDLLAGKTYLILGVDIARSSGPLGLADVGYSFVGEAASDHSGGCVASAGDVDGDGWADLLIGAASNDEGGVDAGKTYLFLAQNLPPSPATLHLGVDEDYSFIGAGSGDESGFSVAGVGDVDGDGLGDLLIGAHLSGVFPSPGTSYLFLSQNLPAAPATLFLGADEDYAFIGEDAGDNSGRSVAGAGDVDGDGRYDLLIGAHSNGDGGASAGKTYLFLAQHLPPSPATLSLGIDDDYSFVGEGIGHLSGFSVAGAGDVDADGLDDILIGAPNYSMGSATLLMGKTYLLLAGNLPVAALPATLHLGIDADYAFFGEGRLNYSGFAVAGAMDVDADGLDDILIGAPGNSDAGISSGKTYLFLGQNLPPSPASLFLGSHEDYSFIGETSLDDSGTSVAGAGDVDRDGFDDVLIGSPRSDEGASDAGETYLILGSESAPSGPSMVITGTCPGIVTIDLVGFSPGGTAAVLKGGGPGATALPGGPCVGGVTGLDTVGLQTTFAMDVAGTRTVSPSLSAGACGAWIQVLDVSSCALTVAQALP